jgi:hypothetical protein
MPMQVKTIGDQSSGCITFADTPTYNVKKSYLDNKINNTRLE